MLRCITDKDPRDARERHSQENDKKKREMKDVPFEAESGGQQRLNESSS